MNEMRSRANPFPGLRPFRTEEHHLFFGREEQTAALLALLGDQRFLAVVGTSGSGKSSLVRAGLIPALHRGTMARAGSTWEVVILRPGGNPITSLARGLLDADLYDSEDPEALPRLRATLTRSHFGLVEAVRQSAALDPSANLLVVVDQFEEVFRFREQGTSAEETAGAFVSLLLAASEASERRIYVAITMRSDYLGDCANIPGLAEAVNRGEYLIPRLSRDQRREAIEKPVGVSGARMAPRLVQQMLNDLGDDPDQLPVLQHALLRTWDAWLGDHRDGEPIDFRHYEATGGMATALSRHADEVFEALPGDEHRRAAEKVFKALTVKGADNRGIRRPTRLERLARIAGAADEVVAQVVEAYRRPGVTFLMPGASTGLAADTVIDLSHESLMRVWSRLREWVDAEAQSARVYRRLAETADLWKEGRAGLFRDPDLGIALGWRETAHPTAAWAEQHGGGLDRALEFLDRSRDQARAEQLAWEEAMHREVEQATALAEAERRRAEDRQRAAKRLKALAAGVAVVAVLALAAMGFAVNARRQAVESAKLAKEKEALATQAAGDAERSAAALQRTLVESDFQQGSERIDAGEGAAGLSYLARALRADPGFWPAAARAMTAMASGRFRLRTFPVIAHEKVIRDYSLNDRESLVLTTDSEENRGPGEYFVWDARTGQRLYAVAPGSKGPFLPEWTRDGKHLFVHEPGRKAIRVWEARSGKELEPPIAADGLRELDSGVDPPGRGLLLGRFEDGALQVWRAATGEVSTPRLARDARATGGFGFTPDGSRVYGTYADAAIVLWESDGGAQVAEVSTRPVVAQGGDVFFTPDGETVIWRGDAKRKVGWQKIGGETGHPPLDFEYDVAFWFLPGGAKVAIVEASLDFSRPRPFRVSIYSLETHEQVGAVDDPRPIEGIMTPLEGTRLRFPLVVTRYRNIASIWDLETATQLREIGTPSLLSNADLSPEGRRIFTRTVTNDVMLWDIFTGRQLFPAPIEHAGSLQWRFSPEGEKLVTFDAAKRVLELWETRTGRRLMEPSDYPVDDLEFTAGGERLLLSNEATTTLRSGAFSQQTEGDLRLLDVGARPILCEALLEGSHSGGSARWSPLDEIVTCGRKREGDPEQVMFWDGSTRRLRKSIPLPEGVQWSFKGFALSGDGTRALLGFNDNRARVYDVARGELVCELEHSSPVEVGSLSSDGARAATGTTDGKVRIWDAVSGAPLTEPLDHGSRLITAIALSPDATVLVSCSLDLKVRIVDARTGRERSAPVAAKSIVQRLAFSPDGSHVVPVTFSQGIPVIDVATGSIVRTLEHPDSCRTARFSPDGRILAVGTGSILHRPVGEVHVWEWREGRKVGRPLNARGPVEHMDISSDGSLLVSGTLFDPDDDLPRNRPARIASPGRKGAVQVWDIATGRPITDPFFGTAPVTSVSFNGPGTQVVAAWEDGDVRVIDLPPRGEDRSGFLPNLIEAVAGRRLTPSGGAIEEVPPETLDRLRGDLAGAGGKAPAGLGAAHERWARWFLAHAAERSISPGSSVSFGEHLARLRRSSRVEVLQEALVLAPSDALVHARMALVLLESLDGLPAFDTDKEADLRFRRHWKETADWYGRRAVELAPRDPDVWAHRSEALRRAGRDAGVDAAAGRAHEVGPGNPNAEYAWAVALAGEGKWVEADAAFSRAIDAVGPGDSGGATGPPLLGPLASLEPRSAPQAFRELHIPPPIPGTFEDFESVPEGGVPTGWSARHERTDVPSHERDSTRMASSDSDVFEDWIAVDVNRAAASGDAGPFYADRLLASDRRERIGGISPSPLLDGRFIYSLGGDRASSFVHHLVTPDFDCTGRKAVHAAFRSAYEQALDAVAAIEYSIDEGKTWLPVLYRLDAGHIVKDREGRIDAAATLKAPTLVSPLFLDEAGVPRGRSYGEFIGAPISRELDAYIEGLPISDYGIAKRVEVFRLPLADDMPRVRLRFLHAGRHGWYWGHR